MAELIDKLFERYGVAAGRLRRGVGRARHELGHGGPGRAGTQRAQGKPGLSKQILCKLRPSLDFDGRFAASHEGPAGRARLLLQQRGARGTRQRAARAGAAEGHLRRRATCSSTQWAGYTGNLPVYLEERRRRRAISTRYPTSTASRAACRCSPSSRANTTRRCRSPWCARCSRSGTGEVPAVDAGLSRQSDPTPWSGSSVGGLKIPVDESAAALIPYRGRKFSFRYLSLADVLPRPRRARTS